MKRTAVFFVAICALISTTILAQTPLKEYKAGHSFNVSLPDYMSKTSGLNSASAIQYKSTVKDVYGFIIYDTKEDLTLAEMNFSSISEFYENFIGGFLAKAEKREVSNPKSQKKGDVNFIESDLTFYSPEAQTDIYYLVGVVETKKAFYQVLSWSSAENKNKFKADFQKILYSLND